MATTVGTLLIDLKTDTTQLIQGMQRAEQTVKSTTENITKAVKIAGGAIAASFTFDKIQGSIKQTLDLADSLGKLSQKTGIATDALYSLRAAGKLADVSQEELQISLIKLNKNLGELQMGGGTAENALKNLGISAKDSSGYFKTTDTILMELSDKFADMPDGIAKTTLATELLGKAGANLIPLLDGGSESLKEFSGVMSLEAAMSAQRLNDAFTRLHLRTESGMLKTLTKTIPTLEAISMAMEDLSKTDSMMSNFSDSIATGFNYATKAGFGLVWVAESMAVSLKTVGQIVGAVLSGDWNKIASIEAAGNAQLAQFNLDYVNILENLNKKTEDFQQKSKKISPKIDLKDFQKQSDNFKEILDAQLKAYKDELDITSKDLALNLESYKSQGLISSEALDYAKEYVKIQNEILVKEKELQAYQLNQGKNPEATTIKIQEAIKNIDLLQKELQSSMAKYTAKVNEEFNKSFADFSNSFDALAKKQEETILKTSSSLIDNDPLAALALEHKFTIQKIADDTQATYQQAADKMNEALLKASVLTDKDEIARAYKQINDESTKVFAKIDKAQSLLVAQAEKETKEKADKIRFAWLDDITSAINKGLDASIFDALTGKFESFKNWWSNFWSSMGQAALQGLSRYLSGGLTDLVSSSLKSAMGGNGSPSLFKSFGIAGMSIPAFASASEATSWLQSNSSGLAASDVAAMQNSINSGNFSSSDLKSLVSTASNLKSVYEMMSGGLSTAVFTPFSYAAQGLGSLGYTNAAFGVGQFGYGVANPFAMAGTGGLTGAGAMLGGAAIGGAAGYGIGTLGDAILGKKTNAANYGAAAGALGATIGTFIMPSIGTAIGAGLGALGGSLLGGAFSTSSKQITSQGVVIEDSVTQGITNAFTYQNWNKAGGWFGGGSSGQERQGIDSATLNSLVKAQTTFQSVLEQLNINTKLTAGGSFQSFGDYANLGLSTNFLSILSGQDATQSGIYQQWKNYAESINKSVSEAILTSFGSLKTLNRQIDVFNANLSGGNSLSLSLQYANEDLQTLKDSFDANNVTLANFKELMDASIKASPTPDNITNWNSLATALQTAATAQKAYQDALDNQNKSLKAVLVSFGKLSDTTQIDASLALGIANTRDAYLSFVQNAYNSTILLTDKQKEAISSLSQAYAAQEQTAKAYISSIISLVSNLKNIATSFIDSFSTSTLSTREQIVQYNKLRAQFESFFTSTGELSSSISSEQAQSVYTQLSNLGKTLGQNNSDLVSPLMSQFQNDLSRLDLTSEVINVRIVDGLGQLYSLSAEQIKQLKLLTDDGSVTINELNTISGLTDLQKNNILSAINSTGLSSLSSFDVGTPSIPYDQLAKVHQNEMIVPESFASAIRSGDLTLSGRAPNISSFNPLSNIVDTLSGFIKDIGDYPKKTFDILDDVINGRSTVRVGVVA